MGKKAFRLTFVFLLFLAYGKTQFSERITPSTLSSIHSKVDGPSQVNHGWYSNLERTSSGAQAPEDVKTAPIPSYIPRPDGNLRTPLSDRSRVQAPEGVETAPISRHIPRSDVDNIPTPLFHQPRVQSPVDWKSVPFSVPHEPRSDFRMPLSNVAAREYEPTKLCKQCSAVQYQSETHKSNPSQLATNHQETSLETSSTFLPLDSNVGLIPRSDDGKLSYQTQTPSAKVENQVRKMDAPTVTPDELSFKNNQERPIPRMDEEPVFAPSVGSTKAESIVLTNFSGVDLPSLSPKSEPVDANVNGPVISSETLKSLSIDTTAPSSAPSWLSDFSQSLVGTSDTGVIAKSDSSSSFEVLNNTAMPASIISPKSEPVDSNVNSPVVLSEIVKNSSSVDTESAAAPSPTLDFGQSLVGTGLIAKSSDSSINLSADSGREPVKITEEDNRTSSVFGKNEAGLTISSPELAVIEKVVSSLNNVADVKTESDPTIISKEEEASLSLKFEPVDVKVKSSVVSSEIDKSSLNHNTVLSSAPSWLLDLSQSLTGAGDTGLVPNSSDSSSSESIKIPNNTAMPVLAIKQEEEEANLSSKSEPIDSNVNSPVVSSEIVSNSPINNTESSTTDTSLLDVVQSLVGAGDTRLTPKSADSSSSESIKVVNTTAMSDLTIKKEEASLSPKSEPSAESSSETQKIENSLSVTKNLNESPADSTTIASVTMANGTSSFDNRTLQIKSSENPSESLVPKTESEQSNNEDATKDITEEIPSSLMASDEAGLESNPSNPSLEVLNDTTILPELTATTEQDPSSKSGSTDDVTTESSVVVINDVNESSTDSTAASVTLADDFDTSDNLAAQQIGTDRDLKALNFAAPPKPSAAQVHQTKPDFETSRDSRQRNYSGYRIYRVYLHNNDESVKTLMAMEIEHGFEFLAEPRLIHRRNSNFLLTAADVIVAPSIISQVENALLEAFLSFSILVEDVEAEIAKENINWFKHTWNPADHVSPDHQLTWDRYHSLNDINSFMSYLKNQHSDWIDVSPIGQSSQGRPIEVIKISRRENESEKHEKKAILIDAGMHANEWITIAVLTWIVNELVTKKGSHDCIFDRFDWYFIPMVNPDGYEYSHAFDRLWRKTRQSYSSTLTSAKQLSVNEGISVQNCVGADINRNFEHRWRKGGSSSNVCSQAFAGTKAFSEPEATALSNFIMQERSRLAMYISLRGYSQLWLLPSGLAESQPQDFQDLFSLASIGINALQKFQNTSYIIDSLSNLLSISSGTSQDWTKAVAGVRYSYSIETRGSGLSGLILPANHIIPTSREIWTGIVAATTELANRLHSHNPSCSPLD